MTKPECQMVRTKTNSHWRIRHSDLLRHSDFDIRHWPALQGARPSGQHAQHDRGWFVLQRQEAGPHGERAGAKEEPSLFLDGFKNERCVRECTRFLEALDGGPNKGG